MSCGVFVEVFVSCDVYIMRCLCYVAFVSRCVHVMWCLRHVAFVSCCVCVMYRLCHVALMSQGVYVVWHRVFQRFIMVFFNNKKKLWALVHFIPRWNQ